MILVVSEICNNIVIIDYIIIIYYGMSFIWWFSNFMSIILYCCLGEDFFLL